MSVLYKLTQDFTYQKANFTSFASSLMRGVEFSSAFGIGPDIKKIKKYYYLALG